MKNKATWELKNMVKALSMFELLNTDEENQRLEDAKKELRKRSNTKWKYTQLKSTALVTSLYAEMTYHETATELYLQAVTKIA